MIKQSDTISKKSANFVKLNLNGRTISKLLKGIEVRGYFKMAEMILNHIKRCQHCGTVFGYTYDDKKEEIRELEYPDGSMLILKEPYVLCPRCRHKNYFFPSKF